MREVPTKFKNPSSCVYVTTELSKYHLRHVFLRAEIGSIFQTQTAEFSTSAGNLDKVDIKMLASW